MKSCPNWPLLSILCSNFGRGEVTPKGGFGRAQCGFNAKWSLAHDLLGIHTTGEAKKGFL